MDLRKAKIYNDGSHYIAIPYVPSPYKRKRKVEEIIHVEEDLSAEVSEDITAEESTNVKIEEVIEKEEKLEEPKKEIKKIATTKKDLFKQAYRETLNMTKVQRKSFIVKKMLPYFPSREKTVEYVEKRLEMEWRNLIARRTRVIRKVNINDFNYFVTFTYSDELHTEESFRKSLRKTLQNYHTRFDWKYIGVWERGGRNGRLHFHGIFFIPDGTMPGELFTKSDYSFITKKRQVCIQNTYFNKRFGRSDFEEIDKVSMRQGNTLQYILKYIEKTGEKLVISRGLPTYLMSDIFEDDIACPVGIEDRKRLLFDNFIAMDEGEILGRIDEKGTKKKMATSN